MKVEHPQGQFWCGYLSLCGLGRCTCCSGAFMSPVMGNRQSTKAKPFGWGILVRGLQGSHLILVFWVSCLRDECSTPHEFRKLAKVLASDLAWRVGKREKGCWWAVSYSSWYSKKSKS